MGLFSQADRAKIAAVAQASNETLNNPKKSVVASPSKAEDELRRISAEVQAHFQDETVASEVIWDIDTLNSYIDKCIQFGYAGIDTETTGLDRIRDTIVGASLYVPLEFKGRLAHVYIPMKHLGMYTDSPIKGQLSYEQVGAAFQRLVDGKVKLIFANADYDLAMIYKDLKCDLIPAFYYDVILAWRCIKEDEKDNTLKGLYNKYVLKGVGNPKKFSDFFSPKLFPYSKPEIAALYAGNDARITYDLFKWQLPYVLKDNPKCQKHKLQAISDLVWNVEFPLVSVCQKMHRTGMYLDKDTANSLISKYDQKMGAEKEKLADMVDEIILNAGFHSNPPFYSGKDFNPNSTKHVGYLVYTLLNVPQTGKGMSTDKTVLAELNLPVTNQILKVRSLGVLTSTFIEKLPRATTPDNRIHATFKQIGADTGRFSSADPNMQNIPSRSDDVRHMFRATPGYVMLSSDYSQQEPKLTAFVSKDPSMIDAFKHDKDIYATIAGLAFNLPYERCLEFHPETHEYQPDGKARRNEAKTIVLGITYGRSVVTIADQLFGGDDSMSPEDKIKQAQKVYDAVLNAFPNLRSLMLNSQKLATKQGFVETILGRRRHIPDMQLPEFEFKALSNYVNPDVDPMNPDTLLSKDQIPDRIVKRLNDELKGYKYFGQIVKRTNELKEEGIKVTNNRPKIAEASRKCTNSIIQGSAADMTKLAILSLETDERWKALGGRLLVPVHDELVCEVPLDKWEEGGKLLAEIMSSAGKFLPFPIKCDVETSLRWYGLEFPCPYPKPNSLSNLTEDEIKWLQYMVKEMEYDLPVFLDENGDKPRGDAAKGVNGRWTDELEHALNSLKSRYELKDDNEFIDRLERKVIEGV